MSKQKRDRVESDVMTEEEARDENTMQIFRVLFELYIM